MPALIIPVLWVGGSFLVLGGGFYLLTRVIH
jgi:hypothetical protein